MAIQTVKTGAAVNDGTGDDARTAFTKINQNFTDTPNAASRQVGTAPGNVMEVGAFGWGSPAKISETNPANSSSSDDLKKTQMYNFTDSGAVNYGSGIGWSTLYTNSTHFLLGSIDSPHLYHVYVKDNNVAKGSRDVAYNTLLTSANTQRDPNGFIKNASPIVSLYANKIELNDEAKLQPITLEKLGVGDYLVKGSTGFAQEGWYIEMPKDANGNVLVAVIYEQLENNDISVKTYAKKFDEETGDIVANTAKPRDIPSTRWIDLRLQALPQINLQPLSTDETVTTNAE